jgi:hypothetical protein
MGQGVVRAWGKEGGQNPQNLHVLATIETMQECTLYPFRLLMTFVPSYSVHNSQSSTPTGCKKNEYVSSETHHVMTLSVCMLGHWSASTGTRWACRAAKVVQRMH